MSRLLITDDDLAICKTLRAHYTRKGYDVEVAHSAEEGYRKFLGQKMDAVVTDLKMPEESGFDLLARIRHKSNVPVIIMTAFNDLNVTVNAIQGGANDFVPKPLDIRELDDAISRAIEQGQARGIQDMGLPGAGGTANMIVGDSRAIQEVFRHIAFLSQNTMPASIIGDQGTGKELVALAIHKNGGNEDSPFVVLDCSTLSSNQQEKELFGDATTKGKLELAGNGTLYLVEVSALGAEMQARLGQVIETRKYQPQGSAEIRRARCRILVSSSERLGDLVSRGAFRETLQLRLDVVEIRIPPLRERLEDLPKLVDHLLVRINSEVRKRFRSVSGEVMDCLNAYDWPGNVRELEHALMKAAVLQSGSILTTANFPEEIIRKSNLAARAYDGAGEHAVCAALPMHDVTLPTLRQMERQYIEKILERTNWHKGRTCEILDISRPKLERRINEFELEKPFNDPAL